MSSPRSEASTTHLEGQQGGVEQVVRDAALTYQEMSKQVMPLESATDSIETVAGISDAPDSAFRAQDSITDMSELTVQTAHGHAASRLNENREDSAPAKEPQTEATGSAIERTISDPVLDDQSLLSEGLDSEFIAESQKSTGPPMDTISSGKAISITGDSRIERSASLSATVSADSDRKTAITEIAVNVQKEPSREIDQLEDGEVDEDDEEDVVIRPRSRSKRQQTVSQEPELDPSSSKKVKIEPAPATAPVQEVPGIPSNEDDDEEGNEKVDQDGALKGDRTYISKAFRLPMRGDTYYFLATEIARVSGYRDSYLLFNKNRNLRKLMTTEAEKAFLIQQELIPYSYRNRQIGVVQALSIYKTFGARVVTKGMRVKDDYFAQRAREQGFTELDFANEEDRPVEDRLYAQAEAQRRAETDADVALANKAKSAVEYNSLINQQRKARMNIQREHFQRIVRMQ